jgi:hypothetical protein
MPNIAGSESGSISQRHGKSDPDPDPHQNVMDPEHCFFIIKDDKHSPHPQVKVLTLKESLTELVKHDQGLVSRGAFAINVVNQVRRGRETAVKIVNRCRRQRSKF